MKNACRIFSSCAGTILALAWGTGLVAQQQWNKTGNDIYNTNSGNVGVGTTTPQAKLHVFGPSVRFGDGNSFLLDFAATAAHLKVGGSERLTILGSGFVGIGTLTPQYPLSVAGVIHSSSGGFRFPDGSVQTSAATGGGAGTLSAANVSSGVFGSNSGGGTFSFTGSIGIGTTTPTAKLDVHGGSINSAPTAGYALGMSQALPNAVAGWYHTDGATTGESLFFANLGGMRFGVEGAPYALRILKTTGNVGVGTTSPDKLLHVASSGEVLRIQSSSDVTSQYLDGAWNTIGITVTGTSANNWAGIGFTDTPGGAGVAAIQTKVTDHTNDYGELHLGTRGSSGFATRLMIQGDGNVGIGTTQPSDRLSVAGIVSSSTGGFRFPDGTVQTTAASGGTASAAYVSAGMFGSSAGNGNYSFPGQLSIGTAQAYRRLLISTHGSTNDGLRLTGQGASPYMDLTLNTGGTPYGVVQVGDDVAWRALSINPNGGAVGVGLTSPPAANLHVGGTTLIGGEGSSHGVPRITLGAAHASYGTIGYNYMPSPTVQDRYHYLGADFSSQIYFGSGGVTLRTSASGSVGTEVSFTDVLTVAQSANVGIGTTTPAHKLHVVGDAQVTGTLIGGNIKARYQDLAEWVPAKTPIAAGTVVVLDETDINHVRPSTTAYDTAVAGVVSYQPGILLGEGGEGQEMIATTGRVRVRADATRLPIRVGDLLVTSDKPGVAMRSEPVDIQGLSFHRPGTIVGKALEPLASGEGAILVLLSLQ